MAATPTSRSMEHLRKLGYAVDKVERRNPVTRKTNDLFGFIDLLALETSGEIYPSLLAIQATTTSNLSARIKKSLENPLLKSWLSVQGAEFECWGWSKRGARGKRKLWYLKRVRFQRTETGEIDYFLYIPIDEIPKEG